MNQSAAINLDDLMGDAGKSIQIVSVAPATTPENHTTVSWIRRSTATNPVATEQRYRGVTIHSSLLQIPDGSTTSKFSTLLQNTIYDLAAAKFQDYIKERMHETTMPEAVLSLDSVLAFWAEEKQRQTVDAEKITAWLKGSETLAALPANAQTVWLTKLPKIAAPSYRNLFTKAQAAAIVSKIADSDLESPIAAFIANRCNVIIADVSMADAF